MKWISIGFILLGGCFLLSNCIIEDHSEIKSEETVLDGNWKLVEMSESNYDGKPYSIKILPKNQQDTISFNAVKNSITIKNECTGKFDVNKDKTVVKIDMPCKDKKSEMYYVVFKNERMRLTQVFPGNRGLPKAYIYERMK